MGPPMCRLVSDEHHERFCWDGGTAAAAAPSAVGRAPERRARSRLLGAAIVAAVGAAVAAVLVSVGSGGTHAPTVLARAADVTTHVPGYRFRISMNASADGRSVLMAAGGEFNTQPLDGSMWLSLDGQRIDDVVVPPYVYVHIPSRGTAWDRIDLASLGNSTSGSNVDVQQTISFLRSVGAVTTVGSDTLGGVAVTHYHAVVDVGRLASALPLGQGSASSGELAALSGALGGSGMPLDVWLDAQQRVRRIDMSLSIPSSSGAVQFSMSMELYDYGPQPAVGAPPAGLVTDLGSSGQTLSG
jgi:hypothetical protein